MTNSTYAINAIALKQLGLFEKKKSKHDKIHELLAKDGIDLETIKKFIIWFDENQQIWQEFKKYANQAFLRGVIVGAKAVSERVRWESEVEGRGKWDFKLNNNYVAYMARLFNANIGQEYFELRQVRGLSDVS